MGETLKMAEKRGSWLKEHLWHPTGLPDKVADG